MSRWLSGLAWFLVTLFTAASSLGQTTVLIVVQRSAMPEVSACEQRLRSELAAEGYLPTTVQVNEEPNAAVLVDTAKRLSSPAAISIVVHEGTASGLVWMLDPKRPGGLLRAVTDQPMNDQAPIVFAVSATDVLHGGLLELGYIQEPTTNPPPAPAERTAPAPSGKAAVAPSPSSTLPRAKPARARLRAPGTERSSQSPALSKRSWTLAVAAMTKIPLTTAPLALAPELMVLRRMSASFSVGFVGRVALPVTAEGQRASASLTEIWAGPVVELRQSLSSTLTLSEFLESGLVYAKVSGQAVSPLESHEAYFYTLYHHGGVTLSWNLTSDFAVWGRGGLAMAWKEGEVVVVNEKIATLSGPSMILGGGMSVSF
jgi:hypothetical protein